MQPGLCFLSKAWPNSLRRASGKPPAGSSSHFGARSLTLRAQTPAEQPIASRRLAGGLKLSFSTAKQGRQSPPLVAVSSGTLRRPIRHETPSATTLFCWCVSDSERQGLTTGSSSTSRPGLVVQVEKEYVVAAVLTALEEGTVARDYLKKNLSRELQRSRQQHPGDPEAALLALRENMLKHFRDKHPFAPSGSALDRVQAVLAFLDLSTGKLYLSGTGGARAVAASSQHEAGGIETLADVHLLDPRPRGRPGAVQLRGVTVTQLGRGRCRVILGSEGFWYVQPTLALHAHMCTTTQNAPVMETAGQHANGPWNRLSGGAL